MGIRDEQLEQTKRRLVKVAKRLFVKYGYFDTSGEAIVKEAGLTRGALYHHFKGGKKGLFKVLHEQLQEEAMMGTRKAIAAAGDNWEESVSAYFEACSKPAYRQIVLVDGPVVFGSQTWLEMEQKASATTIAFALSQLESSHPVQQLDQEALSRILFGALGEAAMLIASSKDFESAKAKVIQVLKILFN